MAIVSRKSRRQIAAADVNSRTVSTIIDDGRPAADAPIRDALLRLSLLTPKESARVAEHQAQSELDFDQAALELGFVGSDELDRARDQLVNSLAINRPDSARCRTNSSC